MVLDLWGRILMVFMVVVEMGYYELLCNVLECCGVDVVLVMLKYILVLENYYWLMMLSIWLEVLVKIYVVDVLVVDLYLEIVDGLFDEVVDVVWVVLLEIGYF